MNNTIKLLERMAAVVYGDVWIEIYGDGGRGYEINVYQEAGVPQYRFQTLEQAVAHLIEVNTKQQAAFNEALREIGEGE